MFAFLFRRAGGLCWLAFLLAAAAHPAQASHLLGGEMTYRYLDAGGPAAAPIRYEVNLSVYVTCNSSATSALASLLVYDQATGAQVPLTTLNYSGSLSGGAMRVTEASRSACTTPYVPPGCTITGATQPYQLQKFTAVVNLPQSTVGYYVAFATSARNASITNVQGSGSQPLMLYVSLAPPAYTNHSPVFTGNAVAFICANDTTTILNNAVDADGDRLVYSFGEPYSQTLGSTLTLPPYGVSYQPGYSASQPLGSLPGYYAGIDASSGISQFRAVNVGEQYAVAVDVKEYRTVGGQEVLLGTARRDVQLVVGFCPLTTTPVVPPPAVLPRNYTIEVGSTLSIPFSATQAGGSPLELTLNSVLLDGAGGYNATLNGDAGTVAPGNPSGTATATGTGGTVVGTFVYAAGCGEARATPYDVTFVVKDNGCAGKTVAGVMHITVIKPSGPTAIIGPALICDPTQAAAYTASGGTAPGVSWRLSGGGTFVGPRTANPVQVQWSTPGTYTLTARGLTQYGCLTDSVTKTVQVAPALVVSSPAPICQGASATITATGGTSYTVVGGATTLSGSGPFTLSPMQTTTYTITNNTGVASPCPNSQQVTVTVLPPPLAEVGANPRRVCSGVALTLGAAAVASNTYAWSPATGLSDPTIANPILTLNNTSGVPITQTYTLTETNAAGCASSQTVSVTIDPAPVAEPGAAVTLCSGITGQLGAPYVAGNSYTWSPTTSLSSATAANPTVTLTNTTSAAITQTYTLIVTNVALTCPNTATVTVTVNPALQPGSIGSDQTACPLFAPAPLTELSPADGGTGSYT
ncbi:MAG: hypothetical protein ACRYFX_00270, partial [Janthinobacterium lividum]